MHLKFESSGRKLSCYVGKAVIFCKNFVIISNVHGAALPSLNVAPCAKYWDSKIFAK